MLALISAEERLDSYKGFGLSLCYITFQGTLKILLG